MIPLLLLGLISLISASSSTTDDSVGKWVVLNDNLKPCIMMNAKIELKLSYIDADDKLAEAHNVILVPADSTTEGSSCYEPVQVGDQYVDSQVLQLNFPHNEGWNVRIFFTQEAKLGVHPGDWALYQVNVTANYATMPDVFPAAAQDHIHTYFSVIDFNNPPDIADDEYTKVGDYIYCPSPQPFDINTDPHYGPAASFVLSNTQMQAYMTTDNFGRRVTCPDDQSDVDLVPIIVSSVLAGLVLFTLIAYFVYRSRLPSDILDMTQPEFEDEHHHHENHDDHHNQKETNNLNHHDNYGYHDNHHDNNRF